MRLFLATFLAGLCGAVNAAEIVPSARAWTVDPHFEKSDEARESLSGAACVDGSAHCLIVNDEKQYAEFFDVDATYATLMPGRVMKLLADEVRGVAMKEIDAEAVAYEAPYFYVAGSHGMSRDGDLEPSRFSLFRFKVDASTGLPQFDFDDDDVAPEIERTDRLRPLLKTIPEFSAFAEQPLDANGVTIEAMVVQGDDLVFGLRSPSLDGQVCLLHVRTGALFRPRDVMTRIAPDPRTYCPDLGLGAGIRDMAKIAGGLLLLVGNGPDGPAEEVSPQVPSLWWTDGIRNAEKLGDLPMLTESDSAEAVLVLEDTDGLLRVLVLLDGERDGAPREYVVTR